MSRKYVCVLPYDDEAEGIHLNEGQALTLLRVLREEFEVWAITDETGAIPLTAFRFCCRPAGDPLH